MFHVSMTAIFLPVGKCFIISSAIKRNGTLSLIIRLRIVCGKLKNATMNLVSNIHATFNLIYYTKTCFKAKNMSNKDVVSE